VLLYCALGSVAGEAADKLRKLGYTEVYPLRRWHQRLAHQQSAGDGQIACDPR